MVNAKRKLAVVTTHPIQYNAPLFRMLAQRQKIEVKVFYTWEQAQAVIYDPGFEHTRQWDIPLLDGYEHCFVRNTAKDPGSHHFTGINNPDLIKRVEAWGANALLVFGWSFRSHLACMRYFKNRIPVFFRGDSTLLDEEPSLKTLARRLFLRWLYRHVDVAFYVGANNKAYFHKHGLTDNQLVYAPHAVENRRFLILSREDEEEVVRWRKRLGIADRDWVVLFAGKLEEKKDPRFVLELAEKITDPQVKFLLVGNGKLETSLKAQNTDSRILFLDFQNQSKMPLVYRLGQVFLLPSKGPWETWGLAANEAMCAGLPVILSSKVGSAPDLVGDRGTGLVFSGRDTSAVGGYICRLHRNREEYKKVSDRARQHIGEFSFEKIASAIEAQVQARVKT